MATPERTAPEAGSDAPLRILLVDQDASVRRGLRMLLELEADVRVVGEADTCCAALTLVETLQPDVVLTEILPDRSGGLVCASDLFNRAPLCSVVVLALSDDVAARARARAAGAAAFVAKHESYPSLLSAIRQAARRPSNPA